MKLFSYISICILLCVGVVLLVLPVSWFPSFYDVRYMGIASFVDAAIILLVPIFLRVAPDDPDAERKNKGVDLLQFLLTVILINNALRDLGLYQLYKWGFQYDKVIHFGNSFLCTLYIPRILQSRFGMLKNYTVGMAFTVVVLFGIFWEVYEFTMDAMLGTHLYGVYGMFDTSDTVFDLLFNTIGVLSGISASLYWDTEKVSSSSASVVLENGR